MTAAPIVCKHPPGVVAPVIDATRCEGKDDCVRVCPYDVFILRPLTMTERRALPLVARVKVFVHGGKQGFVINPDQCRGYGLCIAACPEKAIKLTRLLGGDGRTSAV